MENEGTDAERNGQTRLARPVSQARTETGKNQFLSVQLTTIRIGNCADWCVTCNNYRYIHTCEEKQA